jgi:hypothetical protein
MAPTEKHDISSMQDVTQAVKIALAYKKTGFLPLDQETRSHVDTATAAFHLNRKEQTMRSWACLENGPIRPTRINGRLAWAVADIKRVLKEGV